MRDVAQEIISRRKKRVLTIDKAWDGNEGFIAWYCLFQDGKFYPLLLKPLYNKTSSYDYEMVEYFNPYIAFSYFTGTNFLIEFFHLSTNSIATAVVAHHPKIGEYTIGGDRHAVYYSWGNLVFLNLRTLLSVSLSVPNLKDFTIWKNRIFLIKEESGKNVLYFSRQFSSAPPEIFFYDPANPSLSFFTFPENFTVLPYHTFYFLHKNYLLTENVLYELEERRYGNMIQYAVVPRFKFVAFENLRIQINKLGIFWGGDNGFFTPEGQFISSYTIKPILSSQIPLTIENKLFASIKGENFQIDFHKSDNLYLLQNEYLVRISDFPPEPNRKRFTIYQISPLSNHLLKGKIIFLSSLDNLLYYKYIKKMKILSFKDKNVHQHTAYSIINPEFELPVRIIDKITDEIAQIDYEDGNWRNTRGVGVKFLFYIPLSSSGILPFFEIEDDGGK